MTERHLLILGASGFIGSHLIQRILETEPNWHIHALDLRPGTLPAHPRLHLRLGRMEDEMAWIESTMPRCDTVLPLAAIANPMAYVSDPLSVFELDFEANLAIVRSCVKHKKRILFTSTSEVYGMTTGPCIEDESPMTTGTTDKERWIYASSKQLLERVIYAYGARHALPFTLVRPFNWFGPGLDDVTSHSKHNRVIPHFLGALLRREPVTLIDGGRQRRCFLYIDDGIDALMSMLARPESSDGQIFNIGNPAAELSIAELAGRLYQLVRALPGYDDIKENIRPASGEDYYGPGYQDIARRIPSIDKAEKLLSWKPRINLEDGLRRTVAAAAAQLKAS